MTAAAKDSDRQTDFDVIIIGGGPAGATAALQCRRLGMSVVLLEKTTGPRFHIGESMLPQSYPLFKELGLLKTLWQLPHVEKLGAEFILGDGDGGSATFEFVNGLIPGEPTFNMERSLFDEALLNHARDAGVVIRQNSTADEILRLSDGDVAIRSGDETFTARYVLDCTGQNTLIGRHLKTRKNLDDPELQKVAYFAHFDHVERLSGKMSGYPSIVMCSEGWFWIIGLNEVTTSIGFVTNPGFAKTLGVPADRLLSAAIARCPVLRERMRQATPKGTGKESGMTEERGTNLVQANFSYRCDPFAGPGYFLVGDAAAFLDPIFSTGVLLAMQTGVTAATSVRRILDHKTSPARARKRYSKFVDDGTRVFWRLIREFYQHSFRELFLGQEGPFQMHRAVSSILAGHVFPRPAWKLIWRLWAFHLCVFLQRYLPLVPHRKPFSLLEETPQPAEARAPSELRAVAI